MGRQELLWEQVPLIVQDSPLTASFPIRATVQSYTKATFPTADIHRSFEIGVQLKGSQERYTGGHFSHILPGDIWLNAMCEPHSLRITEPSTDIVVLFRPELLGEETVNGIYWPRFFAVSAEKRPMIQDAESRQRVLAIAQDMYREVKIELSGWRTALKLHILRLLLELSRNWIAPKSMDVLYSSRLNNLARILPALELINSQPPRHISIAEAAAACFISTRQFCRLFTNAMGLPFGQFSIRRRVKQAAKLLQTSTLSEKEIAKETGFNDPSHLHHAFVQQYGCTPGRYRRFIDSILPKL